MPALPQIDVTDAQFNRLKSILPGTTNVQKAAAYVAETKAYWRNRVIDADTRAAEVAAQEALAAAREAASINPDNL